MTPDRWRQVEDLYRSARLHGAGVLADADPELRQEVQKLLSRDSGGRIFDRPASGPLADSTHPPVTPGLRLGPYKIEALLGSGGMGQVFRATDTRLGRNVAIKVSQEKFSGRFEREARAIAALNHHNICVLHDVGPNYLVMELVVGETLAARLMRGPLSIQESLSCAVQIVSALAEAHAKGIVHRDLKPANIMLTKSGVKVLDFGLAKSVEDETLTVGNVVLGTPAYMAPEQREGKECDARADIYTLGLVLLEMATGKRAAPGLPPQLDSLPEKVAHVMHRCLAIDPDDRWQCARDLKSELEWAAKPAVASDGAERPGRTAGVWAAVAALAILALATLAVVHFREAAPERRLTYTTILPPEKTSFDFATNMGPVALSPDGRRMTFAASGEDGKSQLWVRALDTARAQPLQGTQGGMFPFWSPDNSWVAFFADGRLKKIDTRGGPPIALAEATNGRGGSWSANGTIVFAPDSFAPLLKISSNGGNTSTAAVVDVGVGTSPGFPWFLPDGEHFLFTSWAGAGRLKLRVGSLSSTASKIVGEADSNAVYSGGCLLYLRENSLMAQPFEVSSLRDAGEAVPIAERVDRFLDLVGVGAFSVSANGLLAYQIGVNTGLRQLTWFDRLGKTWGTIGEPRTFFDVEFSPDRRSLAASAPGADGNFDLWKYDVARGLPIRLTVDPPGGYYAVWSTDGRNVIFNSTRKGHYDLYRKSANGAGAEELLYADETDKVPTSWSRDGKFLLYFTGGGPRKQLWVLPMTADGSGAPLKPVPFAQNPFNQSFAQFSPDGHWVSYDSDESQRREIYVAPFSRASEKHQISPNGGQRPRWRQDGKEIFYLALDGRLMAAEVRIKEETVEVGAVRALFTRITRISGGYPYDVSADGQRIVALMPVGRQQGAEPVTLVENWTALLKK